MQLSQSQNAVLQKYLVNAETTWEQVVERVCRFVASAEKTVGTQAYCQEEFRSIMLPMKFVPAGSILANAAHGTKGLQNCYVLSSEDNIQDITKLVADAVLTTKFRGGVGINIGSEGQKGYIRPKGTPFSDGEALGPCSILDMVSENSKKITTGNKCFAEGTLLHTDLGYQKVEDVVMGIGNTVNTHKGSKKILERFDNGQNEVFRVTTSKGYSVEVTANHKMAYLDEYGIVQTKPLSDFQVGDSLLLLLGNNPIEDVCGLKSLNLDGKPSTIEILQPKQLDEALAYFLGFMNGNGCITTRTGITRVALSVAKTAPQVKDFLVDIGRLLFGLEGHVNDGDGECWNIVFSSTQLVQWLQEQGLAKNKADKIKIPDEIFQSPSSVVGAFLSGYFDADGCHRGGKGGYGMDSISKEFLEQCQLLLLAEGIVSNLHTTEKPKKNWQTIYRLNVCGAEFKSRFQHLLKMSEKVFSKRMPLDRDSVGGYPVNSVIGTGAQYQRIIASNNKTVPFTRMKQVAEKTRNFGRVAVAEKLEEHLNYFPDSIKSVESCGIKRIYDIEAENVHLLSGNGLYTSNSRRGAFLFSMDWRHPDIWEFIQAKTQSTIDADFAKKAFQGEISQEDFNKAWVETHLSPEGKRDRRWHNANISVQLDDEFFKKLDDEDETVLKLWNAIAQNAHDTADPGIIFIDAMKRCSPIGAYLTTTNPCGELPLPPNSSCNLGSMALSRFVVNGKFDLISFEEAVKKAVCFLDNVLDVSEFATPEQKHNIQNVFRQVGLGFMGEADCLKALGIAWDSEEHLDFIDQVGSCMANSAYRESERLAVEKGPCGIWSEIKNVRTGNPFELWVDSEGNQYNGAEALISERQDLTQVPRRNSTVLSIAPTGSIAQLAACSWAFEPDFGLTTWKQVFVDAAKSKQDWVQIVNPALESLVLSEEDTATVLKTGSLQETEFAKSNPEFAKVFKIAREISPEWHVKCQAQWQKWVDSSCSKTINLPASSTVEEIKEIYLMAYRMGCKGVTIYRSGTLESEPVKVGDQEKEDQSDERYCKNGSCEL